mmetsp:Transcript_606/g.2228  ORF Transcript_606/g.2228 Transcript_606/m.2228 type:complete len:318 (+) Transcript_606:1756-2709(+)
MSGLPLQLGVLGVHDILQRRGLENRIFDAAADHEGADFEPLRHASLDAPLGDVHRRLCGDDRLLDERDRSLRADLISSGGSAVLRREARLRSEPVGLTPLRLQMQAQRVGPGAHFRKALADAAVVRVQHLKTIHVRAPLSRHLLDLDGGRTDGVISGVDHAEGVFHEARAAAPREGADAFKGHVAFNFVHDGVRCRHLAAAHVPHEGRPGRVHEGIHRSDLLLQDREAATGVADLDVAQAGLLLLGLERAFLLADALLGTRDAPRDFPGRRGRFRLDGRHEGLEIVELALGFGDLLRQHQRVGALQFCRALDDHRVP